MTFEGIRWRRLCEEGGCRSLHYARGLCVAHYNQVRGRGDLVIIRQPGKSVADRFWEKVDKNGPIVRSDLGPCWVWTAGRRERGYGAFVRPEGGVTGAHQMAWKLTSGAIPVGMFVCHRCDNPPCVRPDHLFIGTAKDNMADMHEKGRGNPWPGFKAMVARRRGAI